MAFDVEGARKAGYSDEEIADHLAQESKFDVAGARKSGYSDAEIVQHLAEAPATPKASTGERYNSHMTPAEQPGPDLLHQAVRAGAIVGRSALEGVAGLPLLVASIPSYGMNAYAKLKGYDDVHFPSANEVFAQGLREMGGPLPGGEQLSNNEQLGSTAIRGLTGAAAGPAVGAELQLANNPVTAGVGRTLSANPGSQLVAGAGSSSSGEYARQKGAGPTGQLLASLLGGAATGIPAALYEGPNASMLPTPQGATRDPRVMQQFRQDAGNAGPITSTQRPASATSLANADDLSQSGRTQEYTKAVDALTKAGVPLTSGQRSGTNWLKATERTLSEVPWSGKPLQGTFENQNKAYQAALLKMAGNERGDSMVTRQTLENTAADLSKKYATALGNKTVSIADDDFLNSLGAIEAKHMQFVDDPSKARVRQIVNSFLDEASKADGRSGEWYQQQRSLFAQRAMKNNETSDLYADLKNALDDAFRRTAGDAKGSLDSQYARYAQLRDIFNRTGGPAASEGFISPVAVSREAAGSPGGRQWQDFTRAAAAVLPDRVNNSGTAQRDMVLRNLGIGASGGLVPLALTNPAAAATGLVGAGVGATTARALASALAKQPIAQSLSMLPEQQGNALMRYALPAIEGTTNASMSR